MSGSDHHRNDDEKLSIADFVPAPGAAAVGDGVAASAAKKGFAPLNLAFLLVRLDYCGLLNQHMPNPQPNPPSCSGASSHPS